MIIACAADENYAEMAGVFLRSLAVNGDVRGVQVILVGDELRSETVDALRICAEGLDFHYVDLGDRRRHIAGLPTSFNRTATHIRLLLPEIIPGGGRVLYLDTDILINRSIRPLGAMSLDTCLAAAVEDSAQVGRKANAYLARPPDAPYFNAGVLLFDLDAWRQHDVGHRCIRHVESRDDYWPDQDAINVVLDGKIRPLERIWNFFSLEKAPYEEFARAHIVHFIPDKPLSPGCPHPMFQDYLALRGQTPWRDRPMDASLARQRITLFHKMVAERVKRHKQQQSQKNGE